MRAVHGMLVVPVIVVAAFDMFAWLREIIAARRACATTPVACWDCGGEADVPVCADEREDVDVHGDAHELRFNDSYRWLVPVDGSCWRNDP